VIPFFIAAANFKNPESFPIPYRPVIPSAASILSGKVDID
jgi:hypothetical protein